MVINPCPVTRGLLKQGDRGTVPQWAMDCDGGRRVTEIAGRLCTGWVESDPSLRLWDLKKNRFLIFLYFICWISFWLDIGLQQQNEEYSNLLKKKKKLYMYINIFLRGDIINCHETSVRNTIWDAVTINQYYIIFVNRAIKLYFTINYFNAFISY